MANRNTEQAIKMTFFLFHKKSHLWLKEASSLVSQSIDLLISYLLMRTLPVLLLKSFSPLRVDMCMSLCVLSVVTEYIYISH